MKKHIKAIVPLIVFTFFMTSSLVAETVAVVLKVQGTIQLYRSGKVSDQSVKRGFRLQDGDKLVTGPKAFAAVRLSDEGNVHSSIPSTSIFSAIP